jgi:hypothetical protein
MTENPVDAGILRRHFVAIATSKYDDLTTWHELPGVVLEVESLRAWLCAKELGGRRFEQRYPELASNPTKQQVRDALEEPPPHEQWNASDAAVVFITGHGTRAHGSHWIVLKATDTSKLRKTAVRTADIVGWLDDTGIEHLLVILDLCHAGAAAIETAGFDADFPPTWLVLASVTKNQEAMTGALTTAVTEFLAELDSPVGEQFNHGEYLRVDEFLDAVQAKLGDGQRLAHLQPGLPRLGASSCLPNPRYQPAAAALVQAKRRDLALRPEDLAAHWGPRSRGVADESEPGWLFTGRTELMRRLIAATTGPPANVLVTGGAGCGKSAALARLVTLSDPDFLARYGAELAGIPANLRPRAGAVDVAVLATGKLPHEVLAQLCDALDVPRPKTASSVPRLEELRAAWWSWLRTRQELVTIVVDALDEAPHPRTLLAEVLAQLDSPGAEQPRVRLLVGVRSPGGSDDASTAAAARTPSGDRPLADAAEQTLHAVRLRVDEPPWWQPGDLADYATELLLTAEGSPYPKAGRDAARPVAEALAARAGRSFLVARIAATSLAHRKEVVAASDPAWQATLADGVLGVFRDDLHHTLVDPADRLRAVHLLRAVAFGYGRGLPWRQIWPLVANAVADDPERTYGDGDIAWLLDSRMGAYLITTGRTTSPSTGCSTTRCAPRSGSAGPPCSPARSHKLASHSSGPRVAQMLRCCGG